MDEGGNRRLGKWVTRGDVHLLDLVGQAVDDSGQQAFVAQHNGCTAPVLVTFGIAKPATDVASLDVFGGGSNIADFLLALELTVDLLVVAVQLVGEVFKILGNVASSLVALHVILVEIPIKQGLAFFLQGGEELLLDLLQEVEAYEEVTVVGEMVGKVCGHNMTAYLTIEGSLVGKSLGGEALVEVVIDVRKVAPQT